MEVRALPPELAGPALRAVDDPARFLLGSWSVRRQLRDVVTGAEGAFVGMCSVDPDQSVPDDPGRLVATEEGQLFWPGYRDRSRRVTRYRRHDTQTLLACFEDGRPFHLLDLSSGGCEVEHQCGPDRYLGTFRALAEDRLEVRWDVSGERKLLRLETSYHRVGGA
ncbi:MAG: hypothetical protein JWM85_2444 [Acidimicrobiaceae bacterium]|nr:hypothetical protein [Acidimicrobiaceae bacterium]